MGEWRECYPFACFFEGPSDKTKTEDKVADQIIHKERVNNGTMADQFPDPKNQDKKRNAEAEKQIPTQIITVFFLTFI